VLFNILIDQLLRAGTYSSGEYDNLNRRHFSTGSFIVCATVVCAWADIAIDNMLAVIKSLFI